MQLFLCLWRFLVHVVCSLPATRYNVPVRDRPRHHHAEKTQYVSGGVFYLPFGFIDQPLALDEIQYWKLLLEDLRL